jgi:hypothetical protein
MCDNVLFSYNEMSFQDEKIERIHGIFEEVIRPNSLIKGRSQIYR